MIITVIAATGLLVAALYGLFTLIFFGNFNLANSWHLFVLAYTLGTPVLSFVALLLLYARWTPVRATAALVLGSFPLGIWFLWTAEGSRGLIH